MVIRIKLDPLEATTAFLYLGGMVPFNNSNWESLYSNLINAQWKCEMVAKVLVKTGAC